MHEKNDQLTNIYHCVKFGLKFQASRRKRQYMYENEKYNLSLEKIVVTKVYVYHYFNINIKLSVLFIIWLKNILYALRFDLCGKQMLVLNLWSNMGIDDVSNDITISTIIIFYLYIHTT